jgi:ATP-dependent DNA ligase
LGRLDAPFDHQDWIFELKYDGWRALAYIAGGSCRLVSRNGNAFKRFADLCAAIAATIQGNAVLDGEIACLDAKGKPQFYELMRRRMTSTYCAFDLLSLDPTPDGDVIHRKTTLRHHFLQVAVAERVPQIPSHAQNNDHVLEVPPSEQRRSLLAHGITLPNLPATIATDPGH